jgi:hypothetical protein
MSNEELVIENARLRAFMSTCRAEVMRLNQLLAVAEEKLAIAAPVFEAVGQLGGAIDKFTAAKIQAARLEKQLSREGQ